MATEVSISNMALSHIKAKSTIASLDENSTEAVKCKLFYEQARNETLEIFDWYFARLTQPLAEVGTPQPGWIYQYALPSDYVAVREVTSKYRDDAPIPFTLAHSDISDSIVVLTDEEAATVKYTKKITNPTLFPPTFVTAMSYRLAVYLSLPLTGKRELRQEALDLFRISINAARASALSQTQKDPEQDASWIAGRT